METFFQMRLKIPEWDNWKNKEYKRDFHSSKIFKSAIFLQLPQKKRNLHHHISMRTRSTWMNRRTRAHPDQNPKYPIHQTFHPNTPKLIVLLTNEQNQKKKS